MNKLGINDGRGDQYSLNERLHLIRCIKKWSANLYVFGTLTWGDTIRPISDEDINYFSKISNQCKKFGIELWAWMRPGFYKYIMNKSDRKQFIKNVKNYISLGADGFYLKMDDTRKRNSSNPKGHISDLDSKYQAQLIKEIYEEIGPKFKAICGEHYHGVIPGEFEYYWEPILNTLPESVELTWTGPSIWNKHIDSKDVILIDRPILFWDNYFASDTEVPARAPIYPYRGRSSNLIKYFDTVLIKPNNHYAWQFCALQTAMEFWNNPEEYNAEESFKKAIRDLGDMYIDRQLKQNGNMQQEVGN